MIRKPLIPTENCYSMHSIKINKLLRLQTNMQTKIELNCLCKLAVAIVVIVITARLLSLLMFSTPYLMLAAAFGNFSASFIFIAIYYIFSLLIIIYVIYVIMFKRAKKLLKILFATLTVVFLFVFFFLFFTIFNNYYN